MKQIICITIVIVFVMQVPALVLIQLKYFLAQLDRIVTKGLLYFRDIDANGFKIQGRDPCCFFQKFLEEHWRLCPFGFYCILLKKYVLRASCFTSPCVHLYVSRSSFFGIVFVFLRKEV